MAVLEDLSTHAVADGRLRHAIGYLRLAEFFTPPRSAAKTDGTAGSLHCLTSRSLAAARYDTRFRTRASLLPIGCPPRRRSGGAVLIHGGFDSLIEEFYPIWQRIAVAGFDVVAFEGPGQGGARALSGLTFDHAWERPVGAVLDYFRLASAGLVGTPWAGTGHCALRDGNRVSIAWSHGHPFSTGFTGYRQSCAARSGRCCGADG